MLGGLSSKLRISLGVASPCCFGHTIPIECSPRLEAWRPWELGSAPMGGESDPGPHHFWNRFKNQMPRSVEWCDAWKHVCIPTVCSFDAVRLNFASYKTGPGEACRNAATWRTGWSRCRNWAESVRANTPLLQPSMGLPKVVILKRGLLTHKWILSSAACELNNTTL